MEGEDLMDLSSPKRGWSDLSYREYTANTLKMAEYVVTIDWASIFLVLEHLGR